MHPAEYWRRNKEWRSWLGRKGVVVAATTIRVAAPEQASYVPYDFVLVDFGKEKRSFMGAGHERFQPGDRVECVLRKIAQPNDVEIIPYGIKVTKHLR